MLKIACIGGDGTGPEVVREGLKVLEAVAAKENFKYQVTPFDFGGERFLKTGEVLPDEAISELRKYQAIYLGAVGHPEVPPGILEKGLLRYDPVAQRLSIDYARYPEAVRTLLEEVLAVQRAGDHAGAEAFIQRLTVWDERHQALAARMRAQEKYRFRLVRYEALGE